MRVVVAGAGIVGTTVAWRAAQAGHDVTLVDDGAPGAWQVAAGMLAGVLEAGAGEHDRVALAAAGAARWRTDGDELAAAGGTDLDVGRRGTVLVARTDDDLAVLRETLAVQRDLGLEVAPLRARDCRSREPGLHPRVRGGILTDDQHVDPRRVVAAARTAAAAAGARTVAGRVAAVAADPVEAAEAPSVATSARAVAGVLLDDGTWVAADTVVIAAGWRSSHLAGVPAPQRSAVRPVKGQLLVLRSAPDDALPVRAAVRGLVRGRAMYLVPRRDGRLIVGATEEERGEDTTVTAGGLRVLLDAASELVPGVDELIVDEALAGLRPGSRDGRPLIGATSRPGLLLAAGHHRDGVLLSLLTADAIVDQLAGRVPDPAVACADPRRFDPAVAHTDLHRPDPHGSARGRAGRLDATAPPGGLPWN